MGSTAPMTVVVGGPGTGRSTTLVQLVASRVNSGAILARQVILAASRSDAQALRRRIMVSLNTAQLSPRVTTLHGFALGLIRMEPESDFRLLRAPEQEQRIRELLTGLPEDFWPEELRPASQTLSFARQLREFLARFRQLGLDPNQLAERVPGNPLVAAIGRFAEYYLTLADLEQTMDYTELIHRTRILMNDDSFATSVQSQFDAVFVDDIHDLDQAQAKLVVDFAAAGLPVFAFGDPHQRTQTFRGARGDAFDLMESFDGAKRIELSQGFRMGSAVATATEHIRQRLDAHGAAPSVIPVPDIDGEVSASVFDDPASELAHVTATLRRWHYLDGVEWHEIAVVMRAGRSQLVAAARGLEQSSIPVVVVGDALPLGVQHSVQVILNACELVLAHDAAHPKARSMALASPLCGLDGTSVRSLIRDLSLAHPEISGDALLERCFVEPQLLDDLESSSAQAVQRLIATLSQAREQALAGATVGEVLWTLWNSTSWPTLLKEQALGGSRAADRELDAMVEVFDLAARHDTLTGLTGLATFIAMVQDHEIVADNARESQVPREGVQVLTAHRARSGQWRRVVVMGVQEGLWPRPHRVPPLVDPELLTTNGAVIDSIGPHIADERRLFYHACSRAIEHLLVTASAGSTYSDGPSRFIRELGVELQRIDGKPVEHLTRASLLGQVRSSLEDPASPEELRRAAAARLASWGEHGGPWSAALPQAWWGYADLSTSASPTSEIPTMTGSMLESILDCPRKWFLSRRAKAGEPSISGASVGAVVHAIIAGADEQHLALAEMEAHLLDVWDDIEFSAPWQTDAERTEALAMLQRFDTWRRGRDTTLLGTEIPFDVVVSVGSRQVRLVGQVDRLELIDGKLAVIDHKTGRSAISKTAAAKHVQLGLYQLAASQGAFEEQAPGVRELSAASLIYWRIGSQDPLIREQPSLDDLPDPQEEGPTWIHERIRAALSILDSGLYPATINPWCGSCPFRDSCPAQVSVEVSR